MSKIFNLYTFTKIKIFILNFINYKNDNFFKFIIKNIKNSYSQIFQDLLVLYLLKQKKNGSFIEIGVGNGIDLSNTYLLEKNIIGGNIM